MPDVNDILPINRIIQIYSHVYKDLAELYGLACSGEGYCILDSTRSRSDCAWRMGPRIHVAFQDGVQVERVASGLDKQAGEVVG